MTGYPPAMQAQLGLQRQIADEMGDFKVELALSLTQPWATLVDDLGEAQRDAGRGDRPPRLDRHPCLEGVPGDCQDLYATRARSSRACRAPDTGGPAIYLAARCSALSRFSPRAIANRRAIQPKGSKNTSATTTLGRFAWKLENVRRLKEPFDAKGALSLWKLPRRSLADLA
jgi:hypothetical protein